MNRQDAIGIGLSGLCLVHCLALPVLVSLGPALVWMENGWVHLALAGLALVVSLNAMRDWPPGNKGLALKTLAATGLGLLLLGALAGIPELAERAITVAGASLLALSHGAAWFTSTRNCSHDHAPRR
ncbi:MAG: MerC domain-containing protein [Pseudomonadota bacterium]|nr:MerC domain-containing protein [Pseudomonadota bacterium]